MKDKTKHNSYAEKIYGTEEGGKIYMNESFYWKWVDQKQMHRKNRYRGRKMEEGKSINDGVSGTINVWIDKIK